ncbi:MAG: YbjQ family protein [Candidatus Omnitrophica bacterium]|nr:YbjQ family protein [Candidatus Omnitrophota bacterium]
MESLGSLLYLLFFLCLGYFAGTAIEKAHYRDIAAKEQVYLRLPAVTSKNIEDVNGILEAQLCCGSVVISLDYFKRFLASLRKIVGGRIKSYETLLDRGRREAILRMKKQAAEFNADIIINFRFETSGIGQTTNKKGGSAGCFEVLAYGTAVKLKAKQ